jgi:spore maturation protein SpmA
VPWKNSPRAVLVALLVIQLVAHVDRNMLLGFSPQITRDLALSNAQAMYGPANALIQGLTPAHLRSTVTGFTMLLINVFAIAIGNVTVGAVSDHLSANGSASALTTVLLATDVLAIASIVFFALAARGPRVESAPAAVVAH